MTFKTIDILKSFLEKINHPNASIRAETAQVLGQIFEPASSNALFTLLLDSNPEVQDAALESLILHGKHPENNIAQKVVKYLGDPRNSVQSRVSTLLTSLDAQSLKPLIAELQSPIPLERRQAAEILGVLGHSEATEALINALRDSDQDVVASAAQALGRLKAQQAANPIQAAYRLYPDNGHIFASALGQIGDSRTIPFLLTRLSMASGLEAFAIAEALGVIGRPQAMDTLLSMLSTAQGMFLGVIWKSILNIAQKNQMDILSLLSTPQVKDRLKEIFHDDDEQDLMFYLNESLTETSTSRGILILASRISRFPPEIRRALARELGKIGGKEATRHLIKALKDDDVLVMYQATESLAKIGNDEAVSALKNMLESNNEVMILATIRAIKHLKVNPYLESLNKLASHENPSIHRAVQQTITGGE